MAEPGEFSKNISLMRRLVSETASEFWPRYLIAFLMLLMVSGATALSAYVMEDVINEIFVDRRREAVLWVAGAVISIFAIKGAAAYGSSVMLGQIGNRIISKLQVRVFDRIVHQGLDFFEREEVGDLVTRFTQNIEATRQAIDQVVVSFSRDLLSLIGLVIVMVVQDPMLSGLALLIAPPAVLLTMVIMRRVKGVAKAEIALMGQKTQILKETILGIRVVKAFGVEQAMQDRMDSAIDSFEGRANHIVRLQAVTVPMMEALGGFAVGAAIIYGGFRVMDGGAEPGAFFSFITALLMAYEPARRLARFNVTFQRNLVGVALIYDLIDRPLRQPDPADAGELVVDRGEIRFEDVTFSYGAAPALNGLTLEFKPGETTALVGPSGAGKSTIFSLIERFYDPDSGLVAIDGQPIRHVTKASLRRNIALVTQETFLFDGTIRQNIAVGRPGASEEEIIAAAKAANAHEFIVAAAEGYDAQVGEGGGRLSGGQRQRISIARAMLRDAPILLLDEATSALDTVSEAKVQEALGRLMAGRTTLVIAHRLATVWNADRIHVIDGGALVESGKHQELIERDGLYSQLYRTQTAPDSQPPSDRAVDLLS